MGFKCLQSISEAVMDFNSKEGEKYIFDEGGYIKLRNFCDIIDAVADEFEADSFEVSIDKYTRRLCIRMECSDITLSYPIHPYFVLTEILESTGLSISSDRFLIVDLIFKSLWKKPKNLKTKNKRI